MALDTGYNVLFTSVITYLYNPEVWLISSILSVTELWSRLWEIIAVSRRLRFFYRGELEMSVILWGLEIFSSEYCMGAVTCLVRPPLTNFNSLAFTACDIKDYPSSVPRALVERASSFRGSTSVSLRTEGTHSTCGHYELDTTPVE